MSNNNLNKVYTASDIEQYLTGKLSPLQMHEMEKAALDDPFLADAMEGYEAMKEKSWNTTLASICRQIDETGTEAKIIPMHRSGSRWWKTAAAIFLVGCGTILTYVLTRDKPADKEQPIAKIIPTTPLNVKENIAPVTPAEKTGSQALPKENKITETVAQTDPQVKSGENFVKDPAKDRSTEIAKNDDQGVAGREKSNPAPGSIAPPINNTIPAANDVARQNNTGDIDNRKAVQKNIADKKELNNSFIAQVVGADNSPLPFSNISIKSENFGTYADVKGNFRLVSTDSVITIEVRSVGFVPRTITLRSDLAQNKIIMLEDDVAVKEKNSHLNKDLGNVTRTRKVSVYMDSIFNAEPKDGWEAYNAYIANNIDIPDDVLKKGVHGEVGITFDINPNGAITNIKVDKSLGSNYDEAAKRLIEQGPQWKAKRGKKTSARVKVKF